MTRQSWIVQGMPALVLLALLGACTAPPAPTPAPPPAAPAAPVAAPAPPVAAPAPARPDGAVWDELPIIEGQWRLTAPGQADYRDKAGQRLAALACAGRVMTLRVDALGGSNGALTLRSSSRNVPVVTSGGSVTLPHGDGLLDAIAFSRGRFAIDIANGALLVLPVQSEIGRAIEDCRSGA